MNHQIQRLLVIVIALVTQSCKKEQASALNGAKSRLTPSELSALEAEGVKNPSAAFRLYDYYSFVSFDMKKSLFWVRQAAALGDAEAQHALASLIKARGLSPEEYRKWTLLSAAQVILDQ